MLHCLLDFVCICRVHKRRFDPHATHIFVEEIVLLMALTTFSHSKSAFGPNTVPVTAVSGSESLGSESVNIKCFYSVIGIESSRSAWTKSSTVNGID